ncbi:MAG: methyl-accepting chemotaxis protein, partial [Clostridia bacterium]
SGVATLSSFSTNVENPLFIMDIDASSIQSLIDEIHIGDGAETHLISSDGRVITCLKEGETAQNVSDIAGQAFYQNILQSEEMQGSETVSYKGADHIMVYQKVGDSGYTLIGLIPRAELLKTVTVIRYFTVGLVLLAALVALGMGLYMATGMGRTINRIVDVADGAASGDLTLNPTSHRKDELGFLTGSIAKMISNMRELIQQVLEISQKVAGSADTVATTSQQISATSNEIASAIQEIAHGASEQAGDAEQGSSKMEELAGKINNVSDNAKNIHSVSQDTTKLVKDGLLSIEDLDKKCHQTTTITEAILSDIQQLQQQSRSIDKITKVIDGIVGQTKLLALNAAIEAARAGEAGRGFAVVADEVRKLAEQSMEATREITAIIKATHQQTAQTVERAQSAEETIKSQNQSVVATISIFKQISSSMGSLVASVEHIMSGIAEMEENKNEAVLMMQSVSSVSQQTAASSEEITASAEEQQSSIEELAAFAQELSDAAQQLTESITRFKI